MEVKKIWNHIIKGFISIAKVKNWKTSQKIWMLQKLLLKTGWPVIIAVSYTHLDVYKRQECKYCKNLGKATFGYSTTNRTFSRACYYCVCNDLNAFIGHGKCTPNSPVSYTHLDVYKRQSQNCFNGLNGKMMNLTTFRIC